MFYFWLINLLTFEFFKSIKSKQTIAVRKFLAESFHRKLKEYYNLDKKSFTVKYNFTKHFIFSVLLFL